MSVLRLEIFLIPSSLLGTFFLFSTLQQAMVLLKFLTLPHASQTLFGSSWSQRFMSQDRGSAFYDLSSNSHILMHFIYLGDHKVRLTLKRKGNYLHFLMGTVARI